MRDANKIKCEFDADCQAPATFYVRNGFHEVEAMCRQHVLRFVDRHLGPGFVAITIDPINVNKETK